MQFIGKKVGGKLLIVEIVETSESRKLVIAALSSNFERKTYWCT
jgi:hypothetical protein